MDFQKLYAILTPRNKAFQNMLLNFCTIIGLGEISKSVKIQIFQFDEF